MKRSSKWLSAPYILWMVLFTVIPLLLVFYYAFTDSSGTFTLENVQKIPTYTSIFVKSMGLAAIATVICFIIGYPLAYIISRWKASTQRTMLLLVMLPMWMSFLLRTYAWMTLLEGVGLINQFFGLFGLGPFDMINTQGAVVLGMVYNYIPFMILPLYSTMVKIDSALIEAAQDLGANSLQVLRRVLFPLTVPDIVSGFMMVYVPSVSTFIISRMLGGGSNMLIGDLIELQFVGSTYNPYLGSAISLLLMVVMLIILGIMNMFDKEEMEGMLI